MVDPDEIVFFPGVGQVTLRTAVRRVCDGSAPASPHLDLFRGQGCEPSIYTMADIERFASLPEFLG
jgi:hypothetical protein